MPKLIRYRKEGAATYEIEAAKVVTIGRSPASTIPIDDRASSRKHCMIKFEEGTFRLIDLGSANGTFVNGRRVREHVLATDDKIRIGQTILVFSE